MRRVALLFALLALSCDPVVRRVVTFNFDPAGERVTITAATTIDDALPNSAQAAEAEEERSALLAERDPWSIRFAQANPDAEQLTFERVHGQLKSAQRRATVATEQLQKFFFDTPITVTTLRGDGWIELTVYAGNSNRATTAQRRLAEKMLDAYSARAVAYFDAVRQMYAYLDDHPQRAHEMFVDVFEGEERLLLSDTERSLTDRVRESIDALIDTTEIDRTVSIDRMFDLVYDPFPARMRVIIHGVALGSEGFKRIDGETYEIAMPAALDAVAALEGRWISPDPLALALRTEEKDAAVVAAAIENQPRRFDPVVTRAEVAAAIVEQMRPAPRYRLRWVTRPAPAS